MDGERFWTVLCVDDDPGLHASVALALDSVRILDRPVELLHATTVAEAEEHLDRRDDIAVVLLDFHLAGGQSGFDLVEVVRRTVRGRALRIIAMSGMVPVGDRQDIVTRYAVNYFLAKEDLTRSHLVVVLTNAVRAYLEMTQVHQGASGADVQAEHEAAARFEPEVLQALDNGDMYVVYQPQHDIRTRRVIGAEALLRWRNDLGPNRSPAEFVPELESTGLMAEVGKWMLRRSLEDFTGLPGDLRSQITLAVNIGVGQLSTPGSARGLLDIVAGFDWPAERLEFEVTERVIADTDELLDEQVRELFDAGHPIAIDDFGTGYSSLHRLLALPVTSLKLDRAFVQQLESADTRTLVEGILDICRRLGFDGIAEGVETEEQVRILTELGCGSVQGFLLSRPGTLEDLVTVVQRSAALSG